MVNRTNNNKNTEVIAEVKNRREDKGRAIVASRTIYRIKGSNVYYVESESTDGIFYYVMCDTEKDFSYCTCKDYETRSNKCKHLSCSICNPG